MPFNTTTISSLHRPLLARRSVLVAPSHILDLDFRDIRLYILYYICFTCTRFVDYRLRFDEEAEKTNIPPLKFDRRLFYFFDIDVVKKDALSHEILMYEQTQSNYSASSLTLLRYVASNGQEKRVRLPRRRWVAIQPTVTYTIVALGTTSYIVELNDLSISLVSLDRGFPRDHGQEDVSLVRSESVRRNHEPPDRITTGKK